MLIVNVASGQQPKEIKRVFILFTGLKGLPGHVLTEEGMRVSLEKIEDFQFEYFIEYMDYYRFTDASYKKNLLDLYRKEKNMSLFVLNALYLN